MADYWIDIDPKYDVAAKSAVAHALAMRAPLQGWCSEAKAVGLCRSIFLAVDGSPKLPLMCVEIGVFGGQSLVAMAAACHVLGAPGRARVFGVDPWAVDAALAHVANQVDVDWWRKIDYEATHAQVLKAIVDRNIGSSTSVLRMTSERACRLFDDEEIGVLHIDGNHSEEESCADVGRWLPKVRPGGLVWFDDIDWPSTQRAQERLRQVAVQVGSVGTCGLFIKGS